MGCILDLLERVRDVAADDACFAARRITHHQYLSIITIATITITIITITIAITITRRQRSTLSNKPCFTSSRILKAI